MKKFFAISIGVVLCMGAVIAEPVLGQSGGGKRMMERFQMLDTDSDGQISLTEATEWHSMVFATMDSDEDAQLSRKEYLGVQLGQGADPDQRGPRFAEKQAEKDASFTKMDADGDEHVSQDQFLAYRMDQFTTTDTNNDGFLSIPEFVGSR